MIEMIRQDMDEIYLLRRLGSPVIRPRVVDYPKHTPTGGKSANLVRWRTDWQGKKSNGPRKPTRQEALDRINQIPAIDVPRKLRKGKPLTPFTLPLYAPELAKVFVYLDPLDRIEG